MDDPAGHDPPAAGGGGSVERLQHHCPRANLLSTTADAWGSGEVIHSPRASRDTMDRSDNRPQSRTCQMQSFVPDGAQCDADRHGDGSAHFDAQSADAANAGVVCELRVGVAG